MQKPGPLSRALLCRRLQLDGLGIATSAGAGLFRSRHRGRWPAGYPVPDAGVFHRILPRAWRRSRPGSSSTSMLRRRLASNARASSSAGCRATHFRCVAIAAGEGAQVGNDGGHAPGQFVDQLEVAAGIVGAVGGRATLRRFQCWIAASSWLSSLADAGRHGASADSLPWLLRTFGGRQRSSNT